ncbi:quinon protein alcohol dehydrogenase-like superfamily [Phyllosticta citribraziliensis]
MRNKLVNFFEVAPEYLGPFPLTQVVDKESATLDGYEEVSFKSSHRNMQRLDKGDQAYEDLVFWIRKLAGGAETEAGNAALQVQQKQNECFDRLPYAETAGHNDRGLGVDKCLNGTREELLKDIRKWLEDPEGERLFGLEGMAGTGKSTIGCSVAKDAPKDVAVASFFFQRGSGERGRASSFVTTIVQQLARHPRLQSTLAAAAASDHRIATTNLSYQWTKLIQEPLAKLETPRILLVIDAVDECEDSFQEKGALSNLLLQEDNFKGLNLKFFVTARPQELVLQGCQRRKILHNVPTGDVEKDIRLLLRVRFSEFRERGAEWPENEEEFDIVIEVLAKRSTPLFIAAMTSYKFVTLNKFQPRKRFELLRRNSEASKPEPELDVKYLTIIRYAIASGGVDTRDEIMPMYRTIIGSVVTLKDTLVAEDLAKLISEECGVVKRFLAEFSAVLVVSKPTEPVSIFHESFRDFVLDQNRHQKAATLTKHEGDLNFDPKDLWIDERKAHADLLHHCLRTMGKYLKEDICNLRVPDAAASEVSQEQLQIHIPAHVRYACRYWIVHFLSCCKSGDKECGKVLEFLKKHLLHWLEAMSCFNSMAETVKMTNDLKQYLKKSLGHGSASLSSELLEFVLESQRFLRYNKQAFEKWPLQLYSSALLFCPEKSPIRDLFFRRPAWIVNQPSVSKEWSATVQVLEGHEEPVTQIAFSSCGTSIVSWSMDNEMIIWDAETGNLRGRRRIQGFTRQSPPSSFAVSTDVLVYPLSDNRLGLLNVKEMEELGQLKGFCPKFSPDGTILAVLSESNEIFIWRITDTKTFPTLQTMLQLQLEDCESLIVETFFNASGSYFTALSRLVEDSLEPGRSCRGSSLFHPSGKFLISGLRSSKTKLWDIENQRLVRIIINPSNYGPVSAGYVDLLSNAFNDVANPSHEPEKLQETEGPDTPHRIPMHVSISPNGKTLAEVSLRTKRCVRVWDIDLGAPVNTLSGQGGALWSLAFSPDSNLLASGGQDKDIRVWDLQPRMRKPEQRPQNSMATAISPNGDLFAVAVWDSALKSSTIQIWNIGAEEKLCNLPVLRSSPLKDSSSPQTAESWPVNTRKETGADGQWQFGTY